MGCEGLVERVLLKNVETLKHGGQEHINRSQIMVHLMFNILTSLILNHNTRIRGRSEKLFRLNSFSPVK